MDLFNNKREKPDIKFITKSNIKKVELVPKKKTRGLYLHTQPQRQVRWLLEIPFESGVEEFFVTGNRPTMVQAREIPNTWQRGHMSWGDLYIELRSAHTEELTGWLNRTLMDVTGRQSYGNIKKNMTLRMMDPTGIAIESWHMMGCLPTEVNYSQEAFDTDPILGINLSMDRVVHNY
jgi:hypothetical protein